MQHIPVVSHAVWMGSFIFVAVRRGPYYYKVAHTIDIVEWYLQWGEPHGRDMDRERSEGVPRWCVVDLALQTTPLVNGLVLF